ncbi:hypothetical protein RIF29_39537 [Crotalaria pallida]|uniref:Uncharacterized protein n=1 Tax=Crotalaria pallida TaxID=3830 RepID=A0AAN9HPV6_CROPI
MALPTKEETTGSIISLFLTYHGFKVRAIFHNILNKFVVLGATAEEEDEGVGGQHGGVTVEVVVAAAAGYDDMGTVADRGVRDRDQAVEKEEDLAMEGIVDAGDEIQTIVVVVVAYWLLAAVAEHMP